MLVEGGAEVTHGLIKSGKVNEAVIYLAPILVGDGKKGIARVVDWSSWSWREVVMSCAGEDLCLRGKLGGAN